MGDGFGGGGGQKDGLGLVAVAGEDGLTVVQDEGDITLLQRAELKEKAIVLFKAKLLPLVCVDSVEKSPAGVMGNLLKDGEQGMGIGFEHCYTNE